MAQALRYAAALLVVGMWGSSFVVSKWAMEATGPFAVAFLRWAIAAAALIAWIALAPGRIALPGGGAATRVGLAWDLLRRRPLLVGVSALFGISLFYAFQNLALRYTTAVNAGILANLTTIFIAVLAGLWLGERLRPVEWLAMAVAFGGAALISAGAGNMRLSAPGLLGDGLMVLATTFAAVFTVGSKRLVAHYPAEVVTTLIAAIGAVLLLPLALWEGLSLRLPAAAWGSLLLLGLGSGALGNLFWLFLLQRMDAARAGAVLYLIPIFSTVLAVALLHEPVTPVMIAGAGLVLAGVAVTQRD